MLSPMEKLEALSRGYSLEELMEYQELRGVALIKDLQTGVEKIYSYSFAKFLEDRNLAEIISVADTVQELMRNIREMAQQNAREKAYKAAKAIERLEALLKSGKSEERKFLRGLKSLNRAKTA